MEVVVSAAVVVAVARIVVVITVAVVVVVHFPPLGQLNFIYIYISYDELSYN